MRNFEQKKILKSVQSLDKATNEIKHFYSRNETSSVIQLLAACQKLAVQLGGYIEDIEGEGTQTVALLETYHEQLYQASVEINSRIVNSNFAERLQKQLISIESSVRDELKPNKIEVAFFPYKAAMFDSMESIWLAAKDDSQCDAYVVPIPYYERLPDGQFGQMHYEGEQYPNNIPITDWQKYDVKARRPDIIFIHTPYDEGNRVTSIHPDFYSKRLKKFTDLLVYVPYFVCMNDVLEHMCINAGTVYADKVIVQSEKVRQTYIRVFKEFEKENNCEGKLGKLEDKIVALGSPKFDKVLNTRREDCALPDEWRRLIERPDGTHKKIVFYNTTISAMLQGNELYLRKLNSVLALFRERDDVVLWWRPHPLSEATYQSMRPSLIDEYKHIVANYKAGYWGIYDDTPDLHRAIALSDAYYGDLSSVVAMYQCTGKLMLIQSPNSVPDNNNLHTSTFEALCDYDGYFWCFNYYFNLFYKIAKHSWETEYLGIVPNETISKTRLYSAIAEYNEKLYFAPGRANEIAIYDVNRGKFSKIEILPANEIAETQNSRHLKFCDVVPYENSLFFISCSYPAFVKLDPETNETEYYSDWLKPLEKLVNNPENRFFWHRAAVIGSCFYLASCNANAVVSFDMKTLKSTVYEVGGKTNGYSDICFDGKRFWLSPNNAEPVVSWSPETGQCVELYDFPNGFKAEKLPFNNIVYCAGYVWLFPCRANMALKINTEDGKISVAHEFQRECERPISVGRSRANYLAAFANNEKICAYTGKSGLWLELDCETDFYVERRIVIANENADGFLDNNFWDAYSKSNYYLEENVFFALDNYLAFLFRDKTPSGEKNKCNSKPNAAENGIGGSIGKSIFAFCKQTIGFGRGTS